VRLTSVVGVAIDALVDACIHVQLHLCIQVPVMRSSAAVDVLVAATGRGSIYADASFSILLHRCRFLPGVHTDHGGAGPGGQRYYSSE
jgi:hypothetical protein